MASEQTAYRTIMPKPADYEPASDGSLKRGRAVAACAACRQRKTKCDAERPACGECVSKQTKCVYELTASKRRYGDLEARNRKLETAQRTVQELLHALKSRPEADAQVILQRLREGYHVEDILRQISSGDLLLQLHMKPETNFRFDFPFQPQMPSFLQTIDNPYLNSVLHQTTFPASQSAPPFSSAVDYHELKYLKPSSSSTIVDSRLDIVKPSNWTRVSTDDDLMRLLLKSYFHYEYTWWPAFHKDSFLEDMLSGAKGYCSSLLVNAILAHACHCHVTLPDRREYWNPHSLVYRFFAETKRLWEEESHRRSHITRVQAMIAMYRLYAMYSMDKIGKPFLNHGVMMAHDLKLFDAAQPTWSNRKRHAYALTAWSVYSYTTISNYHFMIPSTLKSPPKMPLPTDAEYSAWFGDLKLRYPLTHKLTDLGYGRVFKARAEMCIILNDMNNHLFESTEDDKKPITKLIEDARRLELWFSTLPTELAPEKIVFAFELKLHCLYHNTLINLCEAIRTFRESDDSASLTDNFTNTVQRSKVCLETLVRLSYLRHGSENPNIHFTHFLTVLAYLSIQRLREMRDSADAISTKALQEVQSTLILVIKGLYDQGKNYYLAYTIFHMICKEMTPEESEILQQYTNIPKDELSINKLRVKHIQGQYPIRALNYADDPKQHRLEELAKEYAGMALEDLGSEGNEVGSPS